MFDSKIQAASQLNRVILNPESGWDFENRAIDSSTNIVSFLPFRSFPFTDLKTDRSILEQNQLPNCVRFTASTDTISVLRFDRKRELTAMKNFVGDARSHLTYPSNMIAGLYHVSVILADDDEDAVFNPPNYSSPVLTVRIWSTDPADTSKRVYRDLVVPGSAFYDGLGDPSPRTEPFEYHVGTIEVRIDSFYTRTAGTTESEWQGCKLTVNDSASETQWRRTDILTAEPLRYWEDLIFRNWMGNFEIQIFANSDAHFLVDAVCLSSPAAYGLFASNDAHVVAHSGMYDGIMTRMSSILSDRNGVALSPTRRIPLLSIKEQSPRGGGWPSTRMLCSVLSDSLPSCLPYAAHGAEVSSGDLGPLLEFHRDIVSGYYTYSIDYNYPRMCENPDPTEYYDSLYQNYSMPQARAGRMRDNILWYRNYAQNRALREIQTPWIPFVQNHTNLFSRDIAASGAWWDFDNLREPSAAELRLMSNIALGHGADGIMFYQYNTHGATLIGADSACWPRLRSQWLADSTRPVNLNAGSMGFLGANNLPRVCDWNGENKWDSTKSFISGFLRPIGEFIRDLEWKRSKSWQCNEGESNLVMKVLSQRQDAQIPIDPSYATFVETAEFEKNGIDYLFVINGRAHSEGQRHITIKLAGIGGDDSEYKVTRILGEDETGDIWIVRPGAAPDSTTTANGFTDFFAPGEAALYRLDPVEDESVSFGGSCLGGNLMIEPAAALTLTDDQLGFASGKGIFTEGVFEASNTVFQGCDPEISWDGIWARNGGEVSLENHCIVLSGRAGAGPGSDLSLDDLTEFHNTFDTSSVLNALGGTITSNGTVADIPQSGKYLSTYYGGRVKLHTDSATAPVIDPSNIGLNVAGGRVSMRRTRIIDSWQGISCRDHGRVESRFIYTDIGLNRIHAYWLAMLAAGDAEIDFGWYGYYAPVGWGKANSIHVEDIDLGYHVYVMGNACVYADSNYWSFGSTQYSWPNPKTYNTTGTLSVATPLGSDPVPFTGNPGRFSKTQSLPPPPTWRAEVYRALAANQDQQARNRVSAFLRNGIPALSELKEIGRITKEAGWLDLRDTVYTMLLSRRDLGSKIIAADMGIEDSLFDDVLEILNAYSFEASPDLMTGALARKAVCYPLAFQGGYIHGLKALDSLRTRVGNDPIYSDFLELYPKLYSALTFEPGPLMPRRSDGRLIEVAIPPGIELWPNYPNPFRDVTSFTFKLGKPTHVRLTVHDAMGREVAVLTDADYTRGVHSVVLQSAHLPSGLYFYRFMSDEGVIQRKMMLVR